MKKIKSLFGAIFFYILFGTSIPKREAAFLITSATFFESAILKFWSFKLSVLRILIF